MLGRKEWIAAFRGTMVATLAGMTAMRPAWAKNPARDLETRLQQFKAFPGRTSFRIDIGRIEVASIRPPLSSCRQRNQTFIACQYLRDVEAERFSEDEQLPGTICLYKRQPGPHGT